jgi:predicted ATPase
VGELPSGTVTFLFTDIEGSTRLLHELGEAYADALAVHRRVLREAFARHGGVEVDTQGDAFFVAFGRASDALAAAREAQSALDGPIRVRMGLHTGEPLLTDEGYVGIDVHRAARIAAAGHGGQVLISQSTQELVGAEGLRDLGEHRLKDLTAPERIYQLGADDFAPLKSLDRSNLPVAASALVGRERELGELVDLLSDGARVVTLTGTGGSGKTRLALQAAAELVGSHDDVWFVPLAPLADPALVLPTVASTIGAKAELADELRSRTTLLVLDNFEHVLSAAAEVSELVANVERLRVLATSRAPLRIAAEHEFPLEPLQEADAATFFVERARAAGRRLELDGAVVEVCRRLDGLPLALELAAARSRLLDPGALLERLDRRLPLLTGGRRDAPERQRTLRDTISWSYDLLDQTLRRVFDRLSVFVGGFSLAAAEEVCGASLDDLAALVDASLLKPLGTGRFLMLETIREFGLEQLDDGGGAGDVRAAHAAYFLSLAEEAEPHLHGGQAQASWFARLEEERDNLRLALALFRENREVEEEFRLAVASWEFWWMHGYVAEGRGHLVHALSSGTPESEAGANALEGAAYFAYLERDLDDARRWARKLLELAERIGADLPLAKAWHMRALLSDTDDERVEFEQRALEFADDHPFGTHSAESLGLVAFRRGDLERARSYFEQVREVNERVGDNAMVSGSLILLALVSTAAGDHDEAVRYLTEGTRLAEEIGDVTPFIWERCWIALASILAGRGSPAAALAVLGAAERVREEGGAELSGYTAEFHERVTTGIRAGLGEDEAAGAWSEGRRVGSLDYLKDALRALD